MAPSINSTAKKLILFTTILASGMAFLDGTVVNIAIPVIQIKLHANIAEIEWIVNSYTLMLATLILLSGSLGDRYGRKKVFVAGIAIFTAASFFCGISQSVWQLILFRTLQGIGAAMMIPGSLSIINYCFAEKERGRAIGVWSGYAGGLAALGPLLGGVFIQTTGWSSIFFINVPVGIVAFFTALKYIPESKNLEAVRFDLPGALLVIAGLLGISYGLVNVSVTGWAHPAILFSLVAGFLALILFFLRESRARYPLIPSQIFRSPRVSGANIVTLFLYFALSGVIFFFVLNLQQVQHFSPLAAGLSLLPVIITITFLSGAGGSIADKSGPRIPMILGPIIVGTGIALLAIPGRYANYFMWYFPGLLFIGLGMSLVIAPLTKSALSVDPKYSGAASGVNNAMSRVAGLFAVGVLGAVMALSFSAQLTERLDHSQLNLNERQIVLGQKDRLGGIEVPVSMYDEHYAYAQYSIEESFLYGFRWIMGICALLAFLSSGIAAVTIKK